MTDHTDTIRRALSAYAIEEGTSADWNAAQAAIDALLAERQQAIDERDAWGKAIVDLLRERDIWQARAKGFAADRDGERARCKQAIDALRGYLTELEETGFGDLDPLRAVLVKLEEAETE